MLEHHGQLGAQVGQLLGVCGMQLAIGLFDQIQLFAGYRDAAVVRLLQQVDAAQKRAFARARTADDADDITRMGR